MLEVPDPIEIVPEEKLRALAELLPKQEAGNAQDRKYRQRDGEGFDIDAWLEKYHVPVKSVAEWEGGRKFILEACPFDSSHTKKDAAVIQTKSGKLEFNCFHDSCSDKHWRDFRVLYEPDAYSKKAERQQKHKKRSGNTETSVLPERVKGTGTLTAEIQKYDPVNRTPWNDQMFAELFAILYQREVRYNATAREWFFYTGKVWKKDPGGLQARRRAKLFAKELIAFTATIENDKLRVNFNERINVFGKFQARETLVRDAQEVKYVTNEVFNQNPALFNCQNGTLNLDTMEFKPHDPDDFLSQIAGVKYDPDASPAEFETFVSQIMQGDEEKSRYLQRVHGYALTGRPVEECAFFELGRTSRNGKSTLNSIMLAMFGDYGITDPSETIAERKRDSRAASGDLARLAGCRYLNLAEPSANMRVDSGLFKQLTGKDPITARHLHESEFTFPVQFSLFLNTNHLPFISDETVFASDRIRVIEFNRHFDAKERDKGLKERLTRPTCLSGVLNWCVEGLRMYREEGLNEPESVKEASANYAMTADDVGHFMLDCMEPQPDAVTTGSDAYEAYEAWCSESRTPKLMLQRFFAKLRENGFLGNATIEGRTVRNVLKGYALKT